MTIQAIETRYKGYRFRSRLEARWAVFFDALAIPWRYELEGYDLGQSLGYYLPDFWLPLSPRGAYIEIKGQTPTEQEVRKAFALCTPDHPMDAFIVIDTPGDERIAIATMGIRGRLDWRRFQQDQRQSLWCTLAGHVRAHKQLAPFQCALVQRAYDAARSARFEHGETPKVPRGKIRVVK